MRIISEMPAKERRKIISLGRSVVVTIPKPYRDFFELEPGDEVEVLYDSLLLLIPHKYKVDKAKMRQIEKILMG